MTPDTPARGERVWTAGDLTLPAREVARLAGCGPRGRWDDAVATAVEVARGLATPRARWVRAGADVDLETLFPGGTPVARIAERGDACWLFAVTIGPALENRVRALFADHELLDAVLLDAAGSTAAEATCDLLQRAVCPRGSSERFSPGYCGWSLQGQREIFSRVEPDALGMELLDTMLVQPLKSVTGVVVRAAPEDLRVGPERCAACDAQGCSRRQARFVPKSSGAA